MDHRTVHDFAVARKIGAQRPQYRTALCQPHRRSHRARRSDGRHCLVDVYHWLAVLVLDQVKDRRAAVRDCRIIERFDDAQGHEDGGMRER